MSADSDATQSRRGDPLARRITATQLYEFVSCEHKVALDFALDRSRRTPPDEAQRLLIERGRLLERRVADSLGYPTVEPRPEAPEHSFAETRELMGRGVAGIYQGVLLDDRRLAIPDLLRRVEGVSELGPFHYEAGDVKSGRGPRTDQVLQVAFSALLLERIQGRLPEEGFLVLAGGREERFAVEGIIDSARGALASVEEIAGRKRPTAPFLSDACPRCHWRGVCLPLLEGGNDLSLVAGMTPTRRRLLAARGVETVEALAALDAGGIARIAVNGAPLEGLPQLVKQARALATGRTIGTGRSKRAAPPGSGSAEQFFVAMSDPLEGGEPFLIGWARRLSGGAPIRRDEILLARAEADRERIARSLAERLAADASPILHFGGASRRAFSRLADLIRLDPALQGRIEARFFDLARAARAGAYLPVRRYRLAEVAAVLAGGALPALDEPEEAPFVWFENLRLGAPGDWERRLIDRARRELADLALVRDRLEDPAAYGKRRE